MPLEESARVKSKEGCIARTRDERCKGRLAASGRPPEDERRYLPRVDGSAEHGSSTDGAMLADELIEGPWPHPCCQRRVRVCTGRVRRADRVCAEEIGRE